MSYKYYNFFEYKISVFRDERDNDFGAFIEEIPSVSAFGDTPEQAIKELEVAFNLYCDVQKEDNEPIPEPFGKLDYSGKFVMRIPKSLHKKLSEKAKKENVSLNQEALYCLTLGLSQG